MTTSRGRGAVINFQGCERAAFLDALIDEQVAVIFDDDAFSRTLMQVVTVLRHDRNRAGRYLLQFNQRMMPGIGYSR